MRGLPDVSYNADCFNVILVYLSYLGPDNAGYYGICGTSEGSPQWAGIVADLNQYAGQTPRTAQPRALRAWRFGRFSSFGPRHHSRKQSLLDVPGAVAPGYSAARGWDSASGWGTPNLEELPFHAFELLEH